MFSLPFTPAYPRFGHACRAVAIGALSALGLAVIPARAQTTIYWGNNNGANTTFGTAANWDDAFGVPGTTAPSSTTLAVFQDATIVAAPSITTSASVKGIEFTSGAAAWILNSPNGAGATLTIGSSGIVSNAANTQTFQSVSNDLTIALGAAASFTSNSGGITFSSTLTSITNGGFLLTLNGTSTSASNSIGEVISGTGGLTKSGSGTWTMGANHSYSGATTLSDGVLSISVVNNASSASHIGSGTAGNLASELVFDGGTLRFTGGNDSTNRNFTINSGKTATIEVTTAATVLTLSGASAATNGALEKTGAGILLLSGANAHTGATTVSAGTLRLGASERLSDSSALTVASGAIFDLNNFNETVGSLAGAGTVRNNGNNARTFTAGGDGTSTTFSGVLSASTPANLLLTKTGAGTLILTGANTYTGATTISGGSLQIGNGGTTGSLAATAITNNANLAFNRSDALTFSNTITGSGSLTQSGTGTLTLSGTNSYLGGTNLNAGTLSLGSAGAIGASGTISFGGGILQFSASNVSDYSARFSTASNQAYKIDTNGQAVTLASDLTSSGGTLTKTGTGTLTLSGANTYTGATTINAGTLSINADTRLGTAPGSVTPASVTLGGGTLLTTADFSLNANRGITLTAATSSNITASTGTTLTYGGVIAGAGNIQFGTTSSGTGNIVLNAATTHTGSTTIGAGTLKYGVDNALSSATAVTINSGATLDLVSSNATFGSLAGASGSIVDLSGASVTRTLTLGDSTNTSFAGVINDSGTSSTLNLVKQGTGTLSLSGASNFSGTVNVTAGTLQLQNDSALGSGSLTTTVSNGAVLNIDGGRTITRGTLDLIGIGAGAGALTGSGGNNKWNGNLTLSGNTTVGNSGSGYLALGVITTSYNRLTDPPALPADPSTLALGSHTLTFNGTTSAGDSRAIYVNARITGAGNVVVNMTNPTDTVRYTANLNEYTGTTTINRGTLSLRTLANSYPGDTVQPNYFGINGNITIGNGSDAADSAKLLIEAGSLYGEQINYNSKVFINKSGVFNLLNAQSITGLEFTGGKVDLGTVGGLYLSGGDGSGDVIVNASSGNTATIVGTGTSTLSLTIHQGPIPIPNANRRFIVAEGNGGTVSDLTISARITNGSLTKLGDGLMTISGANSGGYEGTTTVGAGILSVQNNTALGQTDGLVGTGTSVTSGATLQFSNAANGNLTVTGEKLTIAGDGYGGRGALQNLIGNNTLAGTANITLSANSTIKSDANLFTISSNITSSASSSLTVTGVGNTTISGIIDSGVVGVTKSGTGTLILSANNDYTGATTINTGGVLSAQAANALGATGIGTTVNSGGALYLDNTAIGGGANQLTVNAEPLSITGTGVSGTGALRNVSGNNTFLGQVTAASSALITANASNALTLGGGVASTAGNTETLTVGTTTQNGDVTIAGNMSLGASYATAVNLTKEGSGTLTFAKAGATLTGTAGAVQLNNGNMTVGTAGQGDTLTTGAFTSKGIVDGLASNTTLTIASGATVTANYTASSNLFNGVLAGAGTFNAIGAADNAGITFGTSFTASNITLKVGSTSIGSTDLNDYFKVSFGSGVGITVGTLEITGDTILDFGNGVNTLTSTNLVISNPNAKIYVMNWTNLSDAWYVNSLINGGSHTANVFGGIPLDQITFQNYNGLTTTWVSGTAQGWLHNEIRPTPEPATYGAILVSGCLGLLGWRRYHRRKNTRG